MVEDPGSSTGCVGKCQEDSRGLGDGGRTEDEEEDEEGRGYTPLEPYHRAKPIKTGLL